MAFARPAEIAQRQRRVAIEQVRTLRIKIIKRAGTVIPDTTQWTGLHLFKSHGERAVYQAAFHRLARHKQCRGTGRAIIIDVKHRNAGHTDFVNNLLPACAVAINITSVCLFNMGEVEATIG